MRIGFRAPDEWEPLIQAAVQKSGHSLEVRPGVTGGASLWLRELVAKELGLEAEDQHQVQSKRYARERKKK